MRRLLLVVVLGLLFAPGGVQAAEYPAVPWGAPPAARPEIESGGFALNRDSGDDHDWGEALAAGAQYLRLMQADITDDNAENGTDGVDETPDDPDDGGWDWRLNWDTDPHAHSTSGSPKNIYGATAIGMYYYYVESGDGPTFVAMTDAADYMIGDADIRSAADLIYLILYNALPAVSGTAYQDAAKAKFDGRIANYGTATALAEYIRDARHGQGYDNGIIAWDIGAWARAGAMLHVLYPPGSYDYGQAAVDIAEVIYQDSFNDNPGYFDLEDCATATDSRAWWYNLGVTGLIEGFHYAGAHTGEIPGLITRLLASQNADGSMADSYLGGADDADWQATAYAAMALGLVDQATYQVELNAMAYWTASTQHDGGGYVYSSGNHYPEIGGENTGGVYFGSPSSVGADLSGYGCLSITSVCLNDVPIDISRGDDIGMRGFNVQFTLVDLELCVDASTSITQGDYLSGVGSTQFYVVDNGGGVYTVSCAILGATLGATGDGTLFAIDVQRGSVDGTGYIQVDEVTLRDVDNHPILASAAADGEVTIDTEAPIAVTNISTSQVKTDNGFDGTTDITVTFGAPVDADQIVVWRAPYCYYSDPDHINGYPEYDDVGAGPPTAPTVHAASPPAPWVATAVTLSGETDEPLDRGFWYYVVFTQDACGNWSDPSNISGGTLNYHLGDVSDGATPGTGDNAVGIEDISLLGAAYWSQDGDAEYFNYIDVGPTGDYSVDALPTTDDFIGFEDLMVFSMNHSVVALQEPIGHIAISEIPSSRETPEVTLVMDAASLPVDGTVCAQLLLNKNEALVKGISLTLDLASSGYELMGVSRGALLDGQPASMFFESQSVDGQARIDLAAVGENFTIVGSGEIARIDLRRVDMGGLPAVRDVLLRDRQNRTIGTQTVTTTALRMQAPGNESLPGNRLLGARPNPFRASTQICFQLAQPGAVSMNVFDAGGRRVFSQSSSFTAGEQTWGWDGRDNEGQPLTPGVYLYTLSSDDWSRSNKLFLVR